MLGDAFKTGRLLLGTTPSDAAPAVAEGIPVVGSTLVILFVLLMMVFLRNFLTILPYLSDSVLRARGSTALENSVRVSRDRNIIALILLIPAVLLIYRYRIYDPDYLRDTGPDTRLLVTGGAFLSFLLLRWMMYRWLRPRRRYDAYQMAYRSGYTFFILMLLLVLPTVGVLWIFHVNDLTIKTIILLESGAVWLTYLLRKAQILSSSCNGLTLFLYLCALELLPVATLVATAVWL